MFQFTAPLHFSEITLEEEVEQCSNHDNGTKVPDLSPIRGGCKGRFENIRRKLESEAG
ncbi:MAG: hypothetical protein RL693_742 [Verrucomicrobiota bacterium]|jgi:hypothetical protein